MLSALLSELGEALGNHDVQLWLELQPDQICGNEQYHSGCICPTCSSMHKEEDSCVPPLE